MSGRREDPNAYDNALRWCPTCKEGWHREEWDRHRGRCCGCAQKERREENLFAPLIELLETVAR